MFFACSSHLFLSKMHHHHNFPCESVSTGVNCQTGKTENRAQGVAEPQSPGATGTEVCLDNPPSLFWSHWLHSSRHNASRWGRCQGWCSINLTAPSAPLREASFETKNAPFWCRCQTADGANGGSQHAGRYWWLHWQRNGASMQSPAVYICTRGRKRARTKKSGSWRFIWWRFERGKEEHHLVLMLAPGEKRLEVDHSSGAATRLWCIKLTTCPLSLTKPMSPPPFSPNLASPKQCSVLQLHILHFHLQIFAFQKPFFVVKMSITLKFRIVHTLMSKTTRNPVGYLELETDVWIARSHILSSEKCNSTPF